MIDLNISTTTIFYRNCDSNVERNFDDIRHVEKNEKSDRTRESRKFSLALCYKEKYYLKKIDYQSKHR